MAVVLMMKRVMVLRGEVKGVREDKREGFVKRKMSVVVRMIKERMIIRMMARIWMKGRG